MEDSSPGLLGLGRRFAEHATDALHNRVELMAVEWQEEKARLAGLLVWAAAVLVMGVATVLLGAMVVILFVDPDKRWWVAAICAAVCLILCVIAVVEARRMAHKQPFAATLEQLKKDRTWLDSSN